MDQNLVEQIVRELNRPGLRGGVGVVAFETGIREAAVEVGTVLIEPRAILESELDAGLSRLKPAPIPFRMST